MDSSSIVVTPQAHDFAKDIVVAPATAPQDAPSITQKGPAPQPISQATGAPDLAPGEKPDPKKQPSIYGEIPQIPVLDAVEGIKFDFNHGIRILFPQNGKKYHVTFTDIDTGIILYSADTVPGAFVTSVKKFFIRFRLIIHDKGNDKPIFMHDYDATDKEVMIQLPVGTIGDSIGWLSTSPRKKSPM